MLFWMKGTVNVATPLNLHFSNCSDVFIRMLPFCFGGSKMRNISARSLFS